MPVTGSGSTEEYILISSSAGRTDEVLAWLRQLPAVREARAVHYGHFDILVELWGPSHLAVQQVIANQLRFHAGVERVDELGDREEAEPILHAIESADA